MPSSPTSQLSPKQALYHRILCQEFTREFYFLSDVAAGRAEHKSDFISKLSGLLGTLTELVPLSGALETAQTVVTTAMEIADYTDSDIQTWGDYRRERRVQRIGNLADDINPVQLSIMIDEAAREAARRYEYFIEHICSDETSDSIIPFAKLGARRMLEYLARTGKPLMVEHLLTGLIEGLSGQCVDGWRNTNLAGKANYPDDLTGEGAYGRCAMVLPDRTACFDRHPQAKPGKISQLVGLPKRLASKIKSSSFGQVKFHQRPDRSYISKYGYMQVTPRIATKYGYQERVPKENKEALLPSREAQGERSRIKHLKSKPVNQAKIAAYLKHINDLPDGKPVPSFNDYVGGWAVFHGELKDMDLRPGDFSQVDFSGCKLTNCQIRDFRFAYLSNAEFVHVQAQQADFQGAVVDGLIATDSDFTNASFIQAKCRYATFEGRCILKGIQHMGLQTDGSGFGHAVITCVDEDLKTLREKQTGYSQKALAVLTEFRVKSRELATKLETAEASQQKRVAELKEECDETRDDLARLKRRYQKTLGATTQKEKVIWEEFETVKQKYEDYHQRLEALNQHMVEVKAMFKSELVALKASLSETQKAQTTKADEASVTNLGVNIEHINKMLKGLQQAFKETTVDNAETMGAFTEKQDAIIQQLAALQSAHQIQSTQEDQVSHQHQQVSQAQELQMRVDNIEKKLQELLNQVQQSIANEAEASDVQKLSLYTKEAREGKTLKNFHSQGNMHVYIGTDDATHGSDFSSKGNMMLIHDGFGPFHGSHISSGGDLNVVVTSNKDSGEAVHRLFQAQTRQQEAQAWAQASKHWPGIFGPPPAQVGGNMPPASSHSFSSSGGK